MGLDPLQSALADTGEKCKIEDINNNMVFEIPSSTDCGTEVNDNGTHLVFSNRVQVVSSKKLQGTGRTKLRKMYSTFDSFIGRENNRIFRFFVRSLKMVVLININVKIYAMYISLYG